MPLRGEKQKKPAATLKEAVQAFLEGSGLSTAIKHPRVFEVWMHTVGPEIAGHTRVSSFGRGVLEIAADSSAMLNELQFHKAALLKDIQQAIKTPHVSRLTFVLEADQTEDDEERRADERAGDA